MSVQLGGEDPHELNHKGQCLSGTWQPLVFLSTLTLNTAGSAHLSRVNFNEIMLNAIFMNFLFYRKEGGGEKIQIRKNDEESIFSLGFFR